MKPKISYLPLFVILVRKGMTASDLAKLTGISESRLSLLKNGKSTLTANSFVKTKLALGVSLDDLCAIEEENSRYSQMLCSKKLSSNIPF